MAARRKPTSLLPVAMLMAAVAVLAAPLTANPQRHPLESLLESQLSPGIVGLLVPYLAEPRAQDRVLEGLCHPSAAVRAISARVIGLTKVTRLSDSVRVALGTESDMFAGREEMRALAILDGASAADPILQAAERMGGAMWQVAAEILVFQEGFRALRAHLSKFHDVLDQGGFQWLIAGAMQRPTEPIDGLANDILAMENRRAWHDFLTVLGDKRRSVDPGILLRGLTHPSLDINGETAWHLVVMFGDSVPIETQAWVDALGAKTPESGTSADQVDLAFGRELLGRVFGQAAAPNESWIEYLGGETRSHVDLESMDALAAPHLTSKEIEAVTRRFKSLFQYKKFNGKRIRPIEQRVDNRVVRTVSSFPRGFVKDLLQITGCKFPKQAENVVQADITYDSIGRPRKVSMITEPRSDDCKEFATALFSTSWTPPQRVPGPGLSERLLLFLEKGAVTRLEEELFSHWPLGLIERGEVVAPKRTVLVKPEYPEGNRQRRLEGRVVLGLVVNPDGNVKDVNLLQVNQDAFLLSAMRSVLGWQYDPALLDSKPVASRLVVIVDYDLRP